MSNSTTSGSFDELQLPVFLMKALSDVGYETPSAIQTMTIPPLLEGKDLVGQAQTGTGKTAAFALPILARLDAKLAKPQALVLAPTRELAIQVAEAFQKYARHSKGFKVLPIYGGSDYRTQLRQLQRGVHVIVGTPGRVMDHMRRGSLDLSALKTLVLDEADEMLRMGFIDDVEWILEQTPPERQIALFSATMPDAIRRIAQQHLSKPEEITIKLKTVTNASIRQRVWMMGGMHKLDALTRILETEDTDGIIIFVRTRIATQELADKLAARGYGTAALNGDIPQNLREKTVENLKKGALDILVATDVAARGLDVERISHVINYDIPNDPEAYVHRIGRTGRAGRTGEAILFAANRERRLLRTIERVTGQKIESMELPTSEQVSDKRAARFKARITETLDTQDRESARALVESYQQEFGVPIIDIAAALVVMNQGKAPATPAPEPSRQFKERPPREGRTQERRKDNAKQRPEEKGHKPRRDKDSGGKGADVGMERYRVEVGHQHGVKPGNIVGAIANEAEVDAEYIGRIQIEDDHSFVDLPEGMPKEIFKHLQSVWVSGQKLRISRPGAKAKKSAKAAAPADGVKAVEESGAKKKGPRKRKAPPLS
ncbi:DEAD/DEAH box helicase [Congregibacter litoralis]|uniref:ATP-dependent RNA helicase DeaD n=1 Tax=Congregibacter litoralis KT71 TaxID=314285 RepID=A4A5U5_9GAMM|nr:DEAD/DEAH box helicase [Congregibacter litoralis]EAQ98392.1 ATP-dependent RNA helicase CsdA [Congregibacter litoralis KT71]